MARRRVFRTRVTCPGITTDLGPTVNQHAMVGKVVMLETGSDFEVNLVLDGAIVGALDATVARKVSAALDRGQSFSAVIEKAFPNYEDTGRPLGYGKLTLNGGLLDIKVEYTLERGQPAIETEKCWRCIEDPNRSPHPNSFFTKVVGVTFEGRQRTISRCSVGDSLLLVRDPNNRYGKGAIKVLRLNGEQLGFVPDHVSRYGDSNGLAFQMDRGIQYTCRIKDLTGGGPGKNLGVNIEVIEGKEMVTLDGHFGDTPQSQDNFGWIAVMIVMSIVLVVWLLIAAHTR